MPTGLWTTWADGTVRWNGAAFWQQWDDFQFSFLGPNGLTIVRNAEGGATIPGVETEVERDILVDLGADLFQGYLFARPGRPFPLPEI